VVGVVETVGRAVTDLHVGDAVCGMPRLPLQAVPDAYKHFDARGDEYTNVILKPEMVAAS
jgi:NADPH:quinone reductase-like Zn-dependent oxidoreductase